MFNNSEKFKEPNLKTDLQLILTEWGFVWTYSKIPVDLRYSCVKI